MGWRELIIRLLSPKAESGKPDLLSQTANITGNGNTVNQILYADPESIAVKDATNAEKLKQIKQFTALSIKEGQNAAALIGLRALEAEPAYHEKDLGFQLHINIALIETNLGHIEQACEAFDKALRYCDPDEPMTRAIIAFQNLLKGKLTEALSGARKLLSAKKTEYSHITELASLRAAAGLKERLTETELSYYNKKESDVLLAYLWYLHETDPEAYKKFVCEQFLAKPENTVIAEVWASYIFEQDTAIHEFELGKAVPKEFIDNLSKASSILKEQFESVEKQKPANDLLFAYILNNYAYALDVLGKTSEAESLLAQYTDRIADKTLINPLHAILFLKCGELDEARSLIGSIQGNPQMDMLAARLCADTEQNREALSRVHALLKRPVADELRKEALSFKFRLGLGLSDKSICAEALEDLTALGFANDEKLIYDMQYHKCFEQAQADEGGKGAADIQNSLKEAATQNFIQKYRLAQQLYELGYAYETVNLLYGQVALNRESPALNLLMDATLKARMRKTAQAIADGLGEEIRDLSHEVNFTINVAILNRDLRKLIPIVRDRVKADPANLNLFLFYASLLISNGEFVRLREKLASVDDHAFTGAIEDKYNYVCLLADFGGVQRARAYAYELFCKNRENPSAWESPISSMLLHGDEDTLLSEIVSEESVVRVKFSGEGIQTFLISNNNKFEHPNAERISLDRPLAQAVLGKKAGDKFTWTSGGVTQEREIVSSEHKFVDALHYDLKRFEIKYPDQKTFKSIKVDMSSKEPFSEIYAALDTIEDRNKQFKNSLRDIYVTKKIPMPLRYIAVVNNINIINLFLNLRTEFDLDIRFPAIALGSNNEALQQAEKTGLIVDAVGCYLLRCLELTDAAKVQWGRLAITQDTMDSFIDCWRDAKNALQAEGGMSFRNGKRVYQKYDKAQLEKRIEFWQSAIEWLKRDCILLPAVPDEELGEGFEILRNDPEFDSVCNDLYAASGSGRLLVSEDYPLRQWGEGLFKLQTTCLQPLIYYLLETDKISEEKFIEVIADLSIVETGQISLTFAMLFKACAMFLSDKLTSGRYKALYDLARALCETDKPLWFSIIIASINGIWVSKSVFWHKEAAIGLLLECFIAHKTPQETRDILLNITPFILLDARYYIEGWCKGHFIDLSAA